jgi:hypothetical protein
MYFPRSKKLVIEQRTHAPLSFLSPINKFGHRSFSASCLASSSSQSHTAGSLREQIRLDTFKKSNADTKQNCVS